GAHRRGAADQGDHRADHRGVPRHRARARGGVRRAVRALAGLHVLEGSSGIATAYAGKLLRDQGAEVVKLEPREGHTLRHWSAASPDAPVAGTGALAAFLDAGKASVTVTTQGERDVFWWGRHWADVVLMERGVHIL